MCSLLAQLGLLAIPPVSTVATMRKVHIGALAAILLALAVPSAHATSAPRVCGIVRSSIPYSAHGNGHRWRVYVAGTSCREGEATMRAIMHLHGSIHQGRDESHSYIGHGAWRCPFGHMGYQYCFWPSSPPYHAELMALECAEVGCPTKRPPDLFPGEMWDGPISE